MSVRKASAIWKGGLKDGTGTVSAPSGIFKDTPYNFRQRFEDEPGTNPEELIAAAHASCFSMAFSAELGKANLTPASIETTANLTFEPKDGKPTITKIHLVSVAKVPGAGADAVTKAAEAAKIGCPISRLLNTEITLDVKVG
jgi:osmotically inducible protein OsmC